MDNHDIAEDLSPEERAAFEKLKREHKPPSALEKQTVMALRRRGLLRAKRSLHDWFAGWSLPRVAFAGLAAVLIFIAGLAIGRQQAESPTRQPVSLFALLIHDDENAPADAAKQAQEYSNWMFGLMEAGRFATGQELHESGRVIKADDHVLELSEQTRKGGYGNIGGFFLIEAASYAEAVTLAATCPHLKYDGSIEIRKVRQR